MALNDTPWCSSSTDKLYVQSGQFTATIKTSQSIGAIDIYVSGISWDGTNTPWIGGQGDKLYLQSGQFTATMKTSQYVGTIDTYPADISWDGTNTPWAGGTDRKLYLQSGQFTATMKTSQYLGATDLYVYGISWDGTNTPWAGQSTKKLYVQSGQFTATIKTSQSVSVTGTAASISWDGTNTPWGDAQWWRLKLQSGQFTATIKSSIGVGVPVGGIDTNDVNARLGTGGGGGGGPSGVAARLNDRARPPAHVRIDASHEIGKYIVQAWGTNSFTGNKVVDLSGLGADGTVSGSPPRANTLYGKAITFLGFGTGKVKASNTPLTGYPCSFVARCRPSTVTSQIILGISNATGSNQFILVGASIGGQLKLTINNGGTEEIGTGGSYAAGDIVEVVGVCTSPTHRELFVNGISVLQSIINTYSFPTGLDRSTLGVQSFTTDGAYFNGEIYWGYWLDVALTAKQVKSLYEDPYQVYEKTPAVSPWMLTPPPPGGGLVRSVIGSGVIGSR